MLKILSKSFLTFKTGKNRAKTPIQNLKNPNKFEKYAFYVMLRNHLNCLLWDNYVQTKT